MYTTLWSVIKGNTARLQEKKLTEKNNTFKNAIPQWPTCTALQDTMTTSISKSLGTNPTLEENAVRPPRQSWRTKNGAQILALENRS